MDDDDFRKRFEADAAAAGLTYTALFKMIITQRLQGPVMERKLAQDLDASPRSIRLALHRLESERLVVRGDNGRFIVRRVHHTEFIESAHVRETLECEAAALAAGRVPAEKVDFVRRCMETDWHFMLGLEALWWLDESLHNLIADHCGNPVMAELMGGLRNTIRLYDLQFVESRRPKKRLEASRAQHLEILRALESGKADQARKAMRAHVTSTGKLKIK